MPVVRSSKTCSRYMPQLRFPVSGLREKTIGSVMNGPPSSGQHVSTGIIVKREAFGLDDLLAGSLRHDLREKRADLGQLRQHLELVEQPFRHAHFEIFD